MKRVAIMTVVFVVVYAGVGESGVALAAEAGLSRTSWGRFGWWETHIHSYNRTNIDGLLSYNVTLEGLMGTIRTRTGQQWAGSPPYGVVPMAGHSRLWNIRFTSVGAGRSRLVLSRTWQFSTDPDNNGLDKGWHKPGFDHSQWRNMIVGPIGDARYEATRLPEKEKGAGWGAQTVPDSASKSGAWENQGVKDYNGWAWYRLEAVIPKQWKGQSIYYQCFGIDDEDHTYINGQLIGETLYDPKGNSYVASSRYLIDPKLIKWGQKNTFAVRVFDDHGEGGFTGTAPELVRGEVALLAQSIKPSRAGDAPAYIKKANWVTKWIDLPDYSMTYSLASAMVRVKPKGAGIRINFEAPIRYAAYVGPKGVQVVPADDRTNYDMRENWLLLWHGNSVGHKEDMPVLVVLHSKPTKININGGEITIESKRSSFEIGPPFGLRHFSGSHTERWAKEGVPNDVVAGCRFWSRAALAYPTGHKELYEVDHDREMVTFTQKYDYEIIKDDWSTKPLKIAAIPPIVACLIDADYPGKMISKRTDPGFVSYHGPFAATVDSDTAVYELPIPIEDVFAALATPGQEADLDLLTCSTANLYQRWSGWDWKSMGHDSGPIKMHPAQGEEPMDLDKARERALLGKYPVIGLPADHKPGAPIEKVFPSGAQNTSGFVPGLLVIDDRVRPGIIAGIRRLARSMDDMLQD
jgi:hypothetical protein